MKSQKKKYKLPLSFQNILTEEEKALYEEYYNTEASRKLREKFAEYFESKISGSYLKTDKETKYEMPSWSEYQADGIGYRRALKEFIKILG